MFNKSKHSVLCKAIPPILTGLSLAMILAASPQVATAAELPVALGRAGNFAVLAGATVTSTGATVVHGDLGVSPGTAVTGFPPGTIVGTLHAGDAAAADAETDLTIAYNDAAGRSTAPVLISGNLGGMTLSPGLYKSSSSLEISAGDLTLDAQGNANAVFIFQMASTFVTTSGRQVILAGGAQAANIFWQVGSSATIGTASVVQGNILADQSISLQTGATLDGKALARIAAVTMDSNLINGGATASNNPPVCALSISCAFRLDDCTNLFVIALNEKRACMVLDGSGSSDSNHDPLLISWVVDGTTPQRGAEITNCLAVGCHSVLLTVDDGQGGLALCQTNVCVITAVEAVAQLISQVSDADLGTSRKGHGNNFVNKRPLLAHLEAASTAFDRGQFSAGMSQLEAFQHKVLDQVGPTFPLSATLFIETAQTILDAVDCEASSILQGVGCDQDGKGDGHHKGGKGDHHGNDKADKDKEKKH
jgi:hypothetical protein